MYRKLLLRRNLLQRVRHTEGAAYVPFCGSGDIAAEMYTDRYMCGADIDADRVHEAQQKLTGDFRVADCDQWPFGDRADLVFAVADFDAWADPWPCFRSFWTEANKADRVAMFFTDGHRLSTLANKWVIYPDGHKRLAVNLDEQRSVYNFYLSKWVWPWFQDYIKPYKMTMKMRYLRDQMTYWGCVAELAPTTAKKTREKVPTLAQGA